MILKKPSVLLASFLLLQVCRHKQLLKAARLVIPGVMKCWMAAGYLISKTRLMISTPTCILVNGHLSQTIPLHKR